MGDLYKLSYYVSNSSPIALQACASFQIFTDICILSQFAIYRNASEKDVKSSPKPEKKYKIVASNDEDEQNLEDT